MLSSAMKRSTPRARTWFSLTSRSTQPTSCCPLTRITSPRRTCFGPRPFTAEGIQKRSWHRTWTLRTHRCIGSNRRLTSTPTATSPSPQAPYQVLTFTARRSAESTGQRSLEAPLLTQQPQRPCPCSTASSAAPEPTRTSSSATRPPSITKTAKGREEPPMPGSVFFPNAR